MKRILIVGASGFSSEVTEYILNDGKFKIDGYFDISEDNYKKYNFQAPFLGCEDNYNFYGGERIVITISNYNLRAKIYNKLEEKGIIFPNIVHSSCFLSGNSFIKSGAILCPFVTITSNVQVGVNFHANIYSYVAHDCIIGNNVTFAPSVKCNGNVIIEDNVYIGTGAIIHQGKPNKPLRIGRGAVIAAGSVVTKNVEDGKTVFGNPAIEFTKENIKRRS